ncbi:cytochrome p450 [Staphylotrichum tortipilum]|uniref:Cytochrome p450 n=1 Tax=Staphylotrichum tortipilum TaxID=2831512 RepID=A0AAN6MAZ0_9PEZI|nr:cytochrome p450 [Staphylotrichum longicolle]
MPSLSILAIYLAVILVAVLELQKKLLAVNSPLRKVPGPWYAPLTTLHLRCLFSTGSIWKLVERSHAKYGPIVRLGPRQVWISDKEAMKQILLKIDLPKVAMYSEISRDRFSPGLFGEIREEPHKRLKRFLSPAFATAYVDNLEAYFKDTVRDLLDKYESQVLVDSSRKGIIVDLADDLHNVALDIMGECLFGKGFGQTNPETKTRTERHGVDEKVWASIPRAVFDGLSERYQMVYVKRFLRKLGMDLKFDWPAEMITSIDAVVQRRKRVSECERRDLLQYLIEEGTKPDTGAAMDTRDIIDQLSEMLLAGSETTSGTLGCLFLELARNPEVRSKLLASLPPLSFADEIVSSKAVRKEPQYEYLEACIKENLRLHPIASEMGRCTGKEWVTLMGYDLPPHTVVSASYRDLHRNEQFWPLAQRFWPERWLSEDKRGADPATTSMDAYYPFSGGKHSCIGINFAWAEMRMVAANILSRFEVTEVPGQGVDFRQYITMQFRTGHWKVVLKPRRV